MEEFPRQHVVESISDKELQRAHPWQCERLDQLNWMTQVRDEVITKGASPNTYWIYFRSPDSTWAGECGTEGWLLFDYLTTQQHGYIVGARS